MKQEGKPICRRCSDTGRKCDGYCQPAQRNPMVLLIVPSDDLIRLGDGETRDAFRYFTEVSAPSLVNYGSHYLWNKLVLQISHHDDSIKHLVVAASALDWRQRLTIETPQTPDSYQYHYGKALQILAMRPNPDAGVVLMACLLFMICDEFQQNRFSALQHIMAGRRILGDYCKHYKRTQYSNTIEELGPIFQQLELQTGELDQETLPHHIRWPFLSQRPATQGLNHPKPAFGDQPSSPLYGYQDIGIAGTCLQALAYSCMEPQPRKLPPATVFHVVPHVTMQLNQWLSNFESTCSRLDAKQGTAQRTQIHVLRMYHLCLSIMSRCAPFDDETLYDQYMGQLEHVVVKATIMLSTENAESLKEKLVCALFFIAAHYRDVTFRMRALCTLRQCGWEGIRLATIAEQMIKIEERGHEDVIVAADIPRSNRIRALEVAFPKSEVEDDDHRGASCTLTYLIHPYNSLASLRRHTFMWEDVTDQALQDSVSRLLRRALDFEFLSSAT